MPLEPLDELVVHLNEGDLVVGYERPSLSWSRTPALAMIALIGRSLLRKLLRWSIAVDATTKLIRSPDSIVASGPG
jgi:hypothetical protein